MAKLKSCFHIFLLLSALLEAHIFVHAEAASEPKNIPLVSVEDSSQFKAKIELDSSDEPAVADESDEIEEELFQDEIKRSLTKPTQKAQEVPLPEAPLVEVKIPCPKGKVRNELRCEEEVHFTPVPNFSKEEQLENSREPQNDPESEKKYLKSQLIEIVFK